MSLARENRHISLGGSAGFRRDAEKQSCRQTVSGGLRKYLQMLGIVLLVALFGFVFEIGIALATEEPPISKAEGVTESSTTQLLGKCYARIMSKGRDAAKDAALSPADAKQPARMATVEEYLQYMKNEMKEDPHYLELRCKRAAQLIWNHDAYREKELVAFLLTPRERFCRKWNLKRAYDHAYLDIGHGVTISGPHLVTRMTSALDIKPGDKVLEIGTGSGYHSAVLSALTDNVYTIEIIDKLAKETDKVYEELAEAGYPYSKIKRKSDDGYYGWEEFAPFDKIIVTCGIDHIPPPLLKQLSVGGTMVIPVGAPGAQIVLKVTKTQDSEGNFAINREDIYQGKRKVAFVPFTKIGGGEHHK